MPCALAFSQSCSAPANATAERAVRGRNFEITPSASEHQTKNSGSLPSASPLISRTMATVPITVILISYRDLPRPPDQPADRRYCDPKPACAASSTSP